MKILLLAAALTMTTAATAQTIPKFKKDAPYTVVREQLLRAGFLAEQLPVAESDRCAPGRTEMCITFPETRWCLGTGKATCEFVLRNPRGGLIQVTAEGESEDPAVQTIKRLSDRDISRLMAE